MNGLHGRITEWTKKMNYDGDLPLNFTPICNPSTAHIWEQIVCTVKPKEEIARIRNNILINRLVRNKDDCDARSLILKEEESLRPIKEIEIWNRKQKLKENIAAARDRVNGLRSNVNGLIRSNKMKYIEMENIKQKIHKNRQYEFLLNSKAKKLKNEIIQVEEMLTITRNLTPVESESGQNDTDIIETLEKCAEKLQEVVKKQDEQQSYRSAKTSATCDDSLGLLDLTATFDGTLASSSFNKGHIPNVATLFDDELHNLIEELLHKNNRLEIWKALMKSNEHAKLQLSNKIVEYFAKQNLSTFKFDEKLLTKLYATHVDFELKTLKTKYSISRLELKLHKLMENIPKQHYSQIALKQQEAGLNAAIRQAQKSLTFLHEMQNMQTDSLAKTEDNLRNVEASIDLYHSRIQNKLHTFKQVHDAILHMRNETGTTIRNLEHFTSDCTWTSLLTNCLSSIEISTFNDFPLEHNRALTIENTKIYLRDLPFNNIPCQDDFDSNTLFMLVSLLQRPWSPSETLLLDILRAKNKLKRLKNLQSVPSPPNCNKYILEELQQQESYIDYALDKLKGLMIAKGAASASNKLFQLQNCMKLWLEMPIKEFVSPKLLLDGAPYLHYEKLYDNFYDQL